MEKLEEKPSALLPRPIRYGDHLFKGSSVDLTTQPGDTPKYGFSTYVLNHVHSKENSQMVGGG